MYEVKPRCINCGTSLMDKDGSEDKPRIDYYPKIRLDANVKKGDE